MEDRRGMEWREMSTSIVFSKMANRRRKSIIESEDESDTDFRQTRRKAPRRGTVAELHDDSSASEYPLAFSFKDLF